MTEQTGVSEVMEPCPFCGESDAFSERADFSSSYIVCNNCLARGPTECQDSDEEEEPGRDGAVKAWNARAAMATAAPEKEIVGQLVEALDWFVRRRKSIENDVLSAHSGRGAGASSFMREDDADFRRDMRAAFDKADTALEAARKQA
jgi:Lar family restriction alleviation protein